jgi:hypothetical protein
MRCERASWGYRRRVTSTAATLRVTGRFGVTRPRLAHGLGVVGYAALTVPLLATIVLELGLPRGEHSQSTLVGLFSMFLLGPALLITAWRHGHGSPRPGTLTVDDDGGVTLRLEGDVYAYAPGSFVDGAVRPGTHEGVSLRLRNGEVVEGRELLTTSPEGPGSAADVVAALGLDASTRAVTLRTSPAVTPALRAASMYGLLFLLLMAAAFALPALRPLLLLPPGAIALWILAWVQHGPAVTVGVDGLRVRQVRSRFLPWSGVARVEVTGDACEAVLTSGERVWLGRAEGAWQPGADALAARIEEARAAGATDEAPRAATTRGARPVGEWRRAMATLLGGAGYRADAVGVDALVGALRAGPATGDQRVGAALALVASDRERHATRVRIAAQALADEPVREAMEAIAAGEVDDATLTRATRGR